MATPKGFIMLTTEGGTKHRLAIKSIIKYQDDTWATGFNYNGPKVSGVVVSFTLGMASDRLFVPNMTAADIDHAIRQSNRLEA